MYQAVNESAVVSVGASPLLVRRGGRDIKKTARSLPYWSGRARVASATARSLKKGQLRRLFLLVTTPSAPLRRLRGFFLLAQPPLLTRRGLAPT